MTEICFGRSGEAVARATEGTYEHGLGIVLLATGKSHISTLELNADCRADVTSSACHSRREDCSLRSETCELCTCSWAAQID